MRKTKTYRLTPTPMLALLALLLVGATNGTAAPGDLDPTFGSGGIVLTSFAPDQYWYDSARTVRVQPDGKIVVCGWISDTDNNGDRGFFLARYHPTGALDASFGTNGKIIGPINTGEMVGNDIALQPDGKIIAVGYAFFPYGLAVHRYNENGTLDASFGAGGVVITPVGEYAFANSVAIQADGKIVVAGLGWSPGQSYSDFAVIRLLPDGSLDTSFGGTGKVITSFGNSAWAGRVVVQPDGKIVAVGSAHVGNNQGLALVGYNSDGSLDSGFGSGGKIIHGVFNISRFWLGDAVLQPDGKIIASGHFSAHASGGGSWDIIYRFNPNGSRDTSFAFTAETGLYIASGIALQTDGKPVFFGYENSGGNYRFAILRLNPNGTPDSGFGTNGRVLTQIGAGGGAADGALQPDGKILALGVTSLGLTDNDIAIVRYRGDSAPTSSCGNPIDCPDFFVRQQYLDFLNREADAGGLAYWTGRITECGTDARCTHERRIGVSAAFFIELEFQRTGYVVYRMHRAAFGTWPGAPTRANLTYAQFTADRALLPEGSDIAQTTINFANAFVARAEFLNVFPANQTNAEFVNKLFDTAGLTPYTSERQQQIAAMNTGRTRAQVLLDVIEIPEFKTREYNRSFVLMEYFGYLRRDPDQGGYDFWLNVLDNREPNNFRGMVCSFLTSTEYQLRFGSTMTRSNADCSQ